MLLYEQHRSLTAAAWRSVVLERFLRSQSAPTIAKLQVRRTRSEKVQTGGDGVQGALEGANRVVGGIARCMGATNIIDSACALLRSILILGSRCCGRLLDLVLLPRCANQRFGHDRASHLNETMFCRHCLDNCSAETGVGKLHIVISHRR